VDEWISQRKLAVPVLANQNGVVRKNAYPLKNFIPSTSNARDQVMCNY